MSWKESAAGKVLASISKYGLRDGLQNAALRWVRNRTKILRDPQGEVGWILGENHPASRSAPSEGPLKINWLIPCVGGKGSGGLMTLFRTIFQLEAWGHEHRVYVVGKTTNSGEFETELARKYYFPIRSRIEIFTGQVADSDALIATNWDTAYTARSLGNTARKFYFVQDLEYLFYPEGSFAEFARETYRWGFHGITIGNWIAQVLQSQFGMECCPFGFSYDREIYSAVGDRRFPDSKRRVLFYARPSSERRGFELGLLALSLVAKQMPDVEFVLVGFSPTSMRLPFPALVPGILNPSELAAVYRSCTVALVLSHTNLSLLPLELMACGCPVVSNTGPNVEWLLKEDTTQLAAPTPQGLADALMLTLQDDHLRARKAAAGRIFAEGTDWTASIRTIESELYRALNISVPRATNTDRVVEAPV
jgi:glycosyltransferase involved in cell wall biosynthesis